MSSPQIYKAYLEYYFTLIKAINVKYLIHTDENKITHLFSIFLISSLGLRFQYIKNEVSRIMILIIDSNLVDASINQKIN